jgi:hypothetical protein
MSLKRRKKGAPDGRPGHIDQYIAESGPHSSCLCASIVVFHSCETFLIHQCDGGTGKNLLLGSCCLDCWFYYMVLWI